MGRFAVSLDNRSFDISLTRQGWERDSAMGVEVILL
jgi:hypothetical protein